ncbi:MAG: undecaprenyl/decaprenyl-phosphate alpha-N-acetylglucosaminyl 1-phosphate transferase [Chitinophagaceae bacterium]|nr:MAG: undecaprenyl/decaprenyl-phosphate alpha-N-acetylglucosaminyl 1-phosphate transferase [Chitinophagaceae bacterium]
MISQVDLLQIHLHFQAYKLALLSFVTAFVVALIVIPPLISFIFRYKLMDLPNVRKEHTSPVPTMGGIAIVAGMFVALLLWFPFRYETAQVVFFFSVIMLCLLGIMDDVKDMPAKYKFMIQFALAFLIALSGTRIQSFDGMFGVYELPKYAQYVVTIIAIVGITNAFNLVDGIDGLAGGLGFMSLVTVGIFLTLSGDGLTALIAFSLAGAVLAFLYYNFNPAKIFMGDTGSLVLGFVIAVMCIRLLQFNAGSPAPLIPHAPVFILGIVLIPVFDTLRVFAMRSFRGQSPFMADRTHIHHLLTNAGFNHSFAARVIYVIHSVVLMEVFLLRGLRMEYILLIMFIFMVVVSVVLKNLRVFIPAKGK